MKQYISLKITVYFFPSEINVTLTYKQNISHGVEGELSFLFIIAYYTITTSIVQGTLLDTKPLGQKYK